MFFCPNTGMKRFPKKLKRELALKRIQALFAFARVCPARGDRLVYLARKLSMKANVPIPLDLKRRFCKHCYAYFTSDNFRVRTRDQKLVVSCFSCKKFSRKPLKS